MFSLALNCLLTRLLNGEPDADAEFRTQKCVLNYLWHHLTCTKISETSGINYMGFISLKNPSENSQFNGELLLHWVSVLVINGYILRCFSTKEAGSTKPIM